VSVRKPVVARRGGAVSVSAPVGRAVEAEGRVDGRGASGPRTGAEGSASVYVLLLLCLICSAGVVALVAAQGLAARHKAGAAADLGALAAADWVLEGGTRACVHAGSIVRANGARLVACTINHDEVDLLVELRLLGGLRHLPPVRARARAGPVQAPR
jgi:secretion/DNA translocation related TadE-like protein